MYRCLIANNQANTGPAFSLYPTVLYTLDHLTIADNYAHEPDRTELFYITTYNATITNSIISTPQLGLLSYDLTGNNGPYLSYCLIHMPNPMDFNCAGNNLIFDDPLFVNPANGDYRLSLDSPAIDAGNPGFPHDDDGSITDLGAFGVGMTSSHGPEISIPDIAVLPGDTLFIPVIFDGSQDNGIMSIQGQIVLPDIVSSLVDVYLVASSGPDLNSWSFVHNHVGDTLKFAMAGATAFSGPTPLFEMKLAIQEGIESCWCGCFRWQHCCRRCTTWRFKFKR